ncbi:beta-ketoacyl-ACP synthase III [Pediococcus claussenii]|uniref:Beta-ketoacyl-[acyl-carrier-protein] synthase III n=1 Tax=Pediococcus claussenii (strain ATCC BAA-344 / DSM 14800 / JCM 18046 / KCTC 3811 / LMG 21948 / P06) TaxID=701521 RepID=G8PEQ3_PEDCP|nr:beta-ketoacyl-ACP synthase III [Pediococcus claussenii]AEV94433.1 3-oxoacyl-[acyl-carrier-] synthase III family protein [Pediococcus claussenii ATCC BAA-344]ANZ69652.1 3-oxoacyl-ACP synthase [Pediococcus claussenii]ANZ71469.1 3-oxoacyl-ACP synthase [Pediococcus claussenii]KRN19863.1 fabH protein [Pediococcus claussenii]
MGLRIVQAAKSLPERIVTNQDLEKYLDTSDEWITKRTGIKERRMVTDETTSSLSTEVAKQLIEKTGIDVSNIDLIIVATMSPDLLTPSTAAVVQGAIGATNAAAFDINVACSGFVYGLSVVNNFMQAGNVKNAILIGAETLSKLTDQNDRSTAVLFGDGAAGVLIQNDSQSELIANELETFGDLGMNLTAGKLGVKPIAISDKTSTEPGFYFEMNGRRVYDFATKNVTKSITKVLDAAQIEADEIDYFLLHQANQRIVSSIAKRLDLDMDRFPININKYGNTAAASEPLLLADLLEQKKIQRGNKLVLSGFGGGLTIGTTILKF